MTVREISNTPEADRLHKARETEQKRTASTASPQSVAQNREPTDRVEISGQARAMLRSEPEDGISEQDQRLGAENDLLVRRLLGELEGEVGVRQERIEEVRQRLRQAHYENPQVLWETARRLIEEIL
ncbi:MAG: hypothetical protein ACUVTG_03470 [Candidatus Oleimicrobiaceae bacterium]